MKNRIGRMPPRPCGPSQCCSGSGSGSPSTTAIMRSTPATMPPAKSPSRKRGVMVSSMMRFATRSVSAPSSPRPTSMRSARSCIATRSSAPSSGFSRPSFQASTTRIEYCSISSGCVVGTISTAICAPFRASKAASFGSRLARSAAVSVPARSVTRASSGGIGCSDCAHGRRRNRERDEHAETGDAPLFRPKTLHGSRAFQKGVRPLSGRGLSRVALAARARC